MTKHIQRRDINYVVGVSWPRSGHGLLARILQAYAGTNFVYCPSYQRKTGISPGRAGCCDDTLCDNKDKVHFCKNHDFLFNVPKVSGQRYLIQYRDFAPSVVSNFELSIRNGCPNTVNGFKAFSRNQAIAYNKFLQKWVISPEEDIRRLILRYEDFTNDAEKTMCSVLNFFGIGRNIDTKHLRDIISNINKSTVQDKKIVNTERFGVRDTRKVTDFRFYDPEWFKKIDEIANNAIHITKIN